MGLIRQGLKLLGTHAVMSLVQFIFMPGLFGIFDENEVYQWIVGLVYIAIFWLVIYADMSNRGLDDAKKDAFAPYKGFIAGLIAAVPAIVLYLLAMGAERPHNAINLFEVILRGWLVPYTKIFVTFEKNMPDIAIIPIAVLPVISGISYIDGLRKRKKILEALKRAEAMRAQRSKVNMSF
ncbi:hypothetical protein JOD02_000334 [Caldicoprobacter guelmensis]|uniref:hypothetical protein n=1 Tax=Caldicoprobacter guelmensis TaxID=1170224 RepID=UPI0019596EBA|nr:hypothetical protein [Caldicoprobacter guelmensis]MBM7581511.1 hypothetical protein [Caldicoprobacter guelmensis]